MGTLFVLGAFIIQVSGRDSPGKPPVFQFAERCGVFVTAHVTKEGAPQEEGGNVRQRLDLETEQIVRGNEQFEGRSGLRQHLRAGARDGYGHPRGDVLARLAAAHVLTYRTDLDGAVTFYLDGLTVSAVLAEPWCF